MFKSYGDTAALQGVTLEVRAGESLAVMGPSGCGKSTLLQTLAGITLPNAGEVTYAGQEGVQNLVLLDDETRAALRAREFGFVFQQGLLLDELNAAENVAVPLMVDRLSPSDAIARAGQLLAQVGLGGLDDRRIGQLSGGQAQRIAIARAIVSNASVVFADEPTGALDSHTAGDVLELLLASTVRQHRALVMVTHDESVARRCSRIARMSDGRVISDVRVTS
ncbi:ABC transporter ATP-binding protein [Zhihengliuella halotolerans]|uniref:ABC transporter ATP-binding protein n=1 Tax=Zhihengliuella halotolerans TaxID=370736 RepID=UPI001F5FA86F|nr:ABC transporter ATP-binding protein [Zhihengliuella halotolerans]